MLILLPPSEGKSDAEGEGVFRELHPELERDTKGVLKHLRGLKGDAVGKFYGIKDAAKAKAVHRGNLAVLKSGGLRAVERYTGVVYVHADFGTIRARKRVESQVQVVSGMFGLISSGTAIPYYKLPMNAWLARYWREINTKRLAEARGKMNVLSLLPQAYSRALALDLDDVVEVQFKVGGGKKLAGHFGKAIKGRFVRYLIENDVKSSKDFDGFTEDGFRFDGTNFVQQ